MISKKQQLLNAIASNNLPLALRIAKDFTIDFDADQRRTLQIAHESQDPSKAKFYTSLGINVGQHQSTPKPYCHCSIKPNHNHAQNRQCPPRAKRIQ